MIRFQDGQDASEVPESIEWNGGGEKKDDYEYGCSDNRLCRFFAFYHCGNCMQTDCSRGDYLNRYERCEGAPSEGVRNCGVEQVAMTAESVVAIP